MIYVRKSADRGPNDFGWLKTFYSFSFNDYYDPRFMGFRDLRVINEDHIEPARGFPKHPHRDMEIITYVMKGELSHRDSMGNGTTILPHEVQRMSAGTGVLHSEHSSETDETYLLQIWILPEKPNLEPSYEQKLFPPAQKTGRLKLIASRTGTDGSVVVHQDVNIYASILANGQAVDFDVAEGRHIWIQVARGVVDINGTTLDKGDGSAISDESRLHIASMSEEAEFLLFDLR